MAFKSVSVECGIYVSDCVMWPDIKMRVSDGVMLVMLGVVICFEQQVPSLFHAC